jgi:hypothetical protein
MKAYQKKTKPSDESVVNAALKKKKTKPSDESVVNAA